MPGEALQQLRLGLGGHERHDALVQAVAREERVLHLHLGIHYRVADAVDVVVVSHRIGHTSFVLVLHRGVTSPPPRFTTVCAARALWIPAGAGMTGLAPSALYKVS